MRNFTKNKFLTDSFVYIFGAGAAGIFNYLFHFVASRKLSVPQYGELQSLLAVFTIFGVCILAINYFIIKYVAVFAEHKDFVATRNFTREIRKVILKYSLVLVALFILVSPLVYKFLHLSNYTGLFVAFAAIIFSIIAALGSGVLNGWERFFSVNMVLIAGAAAKFALVVAFVVVMPTANSAMSAVLISSLATWLLAEVFLKKYFSHVSQTAESWRQKYFPGLSITASVLPIFLFSLMVVLLGNADVLIVKNTTTSEITGYYGALKILGTIIQTVNMAIISVVLPRACATAHKGEAMNKKILAGAYGLIFGISAAATALYYFFPKLIINSLFGAKYLASAGDLWLFGVMALGLSLVLLEGHIAFAKHDYYVIYIVAVMAVIMIVAISLYHGTIRQIALDITAVYVLGYAVTLGLNLFHRAKKVDQSLLKI